VRRLRLEYTFPIDPNYAAVDAGDLISNFAKEMEIDLMANQWVREKLRKLTRPLHSGVCEASKGRKVHEEHQEAWNGGMVKLRRIMKV
jgi:hypothetical protein